MESKSMKSAAEDRSLVLEKVLQNLNLPQYLETESNLELPNIMNTVLDKVHSQNGCERLSEYIHSLPNLVTQVEKSLKKSDIYLKEVQIENEEYIEKYGKPLSAFSTQLNEVMKQKLEEGEVCINKCSSKVELLTDEYSKNLGQLLILKSSKGEIKLTYIEDLKKGEAFFNLNQSYQQMKKMKEEKNVLIKQLEDTEKVSLDTVSSALIPESQVTLTRSTIKALMRQISKIAEEQEALLKDLQAQNETFKMEKRNNSCLWKVLDAYEIYAELLTKVEETKSFLQILVVDSEKLCGMIKDLIEYIKVEIGAVAKEIEVQTTSPAFSSEGTQDKVKPDFLSDIKNICFCKKAVDTTQLLLTYVIKFPNLEIIRPLFDMTHLDKKLKSLGSTRKIRNPNSTMYHFADKESANDAFSYINCVKDLQGLASMKIQIQEY